MIPAACSMMHAASCSKVTAPLFDIACKDTVDKLHRVSPAAVNIVKMMLEQKAAASMHEIFDNAGSFIRTATKAWCRLPFLWWVYGQAPSLPIHD